MKLIGLNYILDDLKSISYYKTGDISVKGCIRGMLSPSFICVCFYRLSHALYLIKVPLFPRLVWWFNYIFFKVDIDQRCKLYGAVYLPHPMMIVIGKDVCLYGAAKIMHGVTLGGSLGKLLNSDSGIISQPIIKGSFFFGINVTVLGPVLLKGKIFILSNTLVTKNITGNWVVGNNLEKNLAKKYENELFNK